MQNVLCMLHRKGLQMLNYDSFRRFGNSKFELFLPNTKDSGPLQIANK